MHRGHRYLLVNPVVRANQENQLILWVLVNLEGRELRSIRHHQAVPGHPADRSNQAAPEDQQVQHFQASQHHLRHLDYQVLQGNLWLREHLSDLNSHLHLVIRYFQRVQEDRAVLHRQPGQHHLIDQWLLDLLLLPQFLLILVHQEDRRFPESQCNQDLHEGRKVPVLQATQMGRDLHFYQDHPAPQYRPLLQEIPVAPYFLEGQVHQFHLDYLEAQCHLLNLDHQMGRLVLWVLEVLPIREVQLTLDRRLDLQIQYLPLYPFLQLDRGLPAAQLVQPIRGLQQCHVIQTLQ